MATSPTAKAHALGNPLSPGFGIEPRGDVQQRDAKKGDLGPILPPKRAAGKAPAAVNAANLFHRAS